MTAKDYSPLIEKFNTSPYARLLGMRVTELSAGYARVALDLTPSYDNWEQMTHGGLIMSLADQAFGCALNTLDRIYVALQFNIHFLAAPTKGGTIYAEGRVIQAGRRAGAGEINVTDSQGLALAKATGTVISLGERSASPAGENGD